MTVRFMWPTWGPPGSCWPQVGPILIPWTFLSGHFPIIFLSFWDGLQVFPFRTKFVLSPYSNLLYCHPPSHSCAGFVYWKGACSLSDGVVQETPAFFKFSLYMHGEFPSTSHKYHIVITYVSDMTSRYMRIILVKQKLACMAFLCSPLLLKKYNSYLFQCTLLPQQLAYCTNWQW